MKPNGKRAIHPLPCNNLTKSTEETKNDANAVGNFDNDFSLLNLRSGVVPDVTPRTTLPASRDKFHFSLFGFLKTTIGKDLTKVTMPVYFNEPLSFLQRLTEDMEYAELLNKAAECESTVDRIAYVAAFASSVYASIPGRFWKPFNPLLGETFEYIDEDKGYAVVCEQVSHHPPVSALHAESKSWVFWEEYKLDTKFRGMYVKIVPTGTVHLKFKKDNYHYSWKKPITMIHNIVIGTLWADHDGDVEVVSHQSGESALVHFKSHRHARTNYKKLTGEVRDEFGELKLKLEGAWDSGLSATAIDGKDRKPRALWTVGQKPESAARFYGFSTFAFQLNESDESVTCPTDSRHRPDQRLLEAGKLDDASDEKHRLEEKQRAARKSREHRKQVYTPKWFSLETDPDTGTTSHIYKGGYWETKKKGQEFEFPDIY